MFDTSIQLSDAEWQEKINQAFEEARAADDLYLKSMRQFGGRTPEKTEQMWRCDLAVYQFITEVTVPASLNEGTNSETQGEYFERSERAAFEFIRQHQGEPKMQLVYGSYFIGCENGQRLPGPHAWVEICGAVVFNGAAQRFYDREHYRLRTNAEACQRISAKDAMEKVIEQRTFWK